MRNNYPEDYSGPKAGYSSTEEWNLIGNYQAFKHVKFGDWTFADFDCWISSKAEHYVAVGKTIQRTQDKSDYQFKE